MRSKHIKGWKERSMQIFGVIPFIKYYYQVVVTLAIILASGLFVKMCSFLWNNALKTFFSLRCLLSLRHYFMWQGVAFCATVWLRRSFLWNIVAAALFHGEELCIFLWNSVLKTFFFCEMFSFYPKTNKNKTKNKKILPEIMQVQRFVYPEILWATRCVADAVNFIFKRNF